MESDSSKAFCLLVTFMVGNVGLYHLGTFLTIFEKKRQVYFFYFFKVCLCGEIHLLGHSTFYCNVCNFPSEVCAQAA